MKFQPADELEIDPDSKAVKNLTQKTEYKIRPLGQCSRNCRSRRNFQFCTEKRNGTTGMNQKKIAVLPGDGIGPEVTKAAVEVLKSVCASQGIEIETEEYLFGGCSIDKAGVPVTDEVIESCKESDAVLLGAVGGPPGTMFPQIKGLKRACSGCEKSWVFLPTCVRSKFTRLCSMHPP